MMQTMKRTLALLMVLVMFVTFVPALIVQVDAAGNVNYVYNGKYIYNWGSRGTVATFLSPNAEEFYADNNTSYTELSSLSGGTGKSNAPQSALYKTLQNLMKSNHDYINGYSENNNLLKYTDCQNSGGKISSFYSGNAIGPNWGEGNWNKEHTWPNSKGLGGKDEDDIMMIRPTSTSENSSRGNTAYGKSSGYYNPNGESNGKYDLRGDVARIFLYVYVRWGNTSYAWGKSGVMESVTVLLEWMEADPVDTWELGRNDSVESITGTRNVFVDYPELAFLLFGEEVPSDMQTPSGGAKDCGHNNFGAGVVTNPTCSERGYTTYTCKTAGCSYSYKANFVAAKGHTFAGGVCSVCGEAEAQEPAKLSYVTQFEVGKAYKLGLYSTAQSAEYFFTGTMSTYYGATDTAHANGVDVYVEQATGGYYLYFNNTSGQKQYISLVFVTNSSGEHYNFVFNAAPNSVFTWDTAKYSFKTTVNGQDCYIGTYGSYFTMSVLRSDKLGSDDYYARLYSTDGSTGTTPNQPVTPPACQHNYTAVTTTATCTAGGYTTYTCTLCKDSYTDNKTNAKGHTYSNDVCIRCGAAKTSSSEAVIDFTDKANRTEFSTTKQVWVQNGITVTNDKANSQDKVADYAKPVRFYAGSNVTISYPGMTKIVIDCTGLESKHVNSWLTVTDATATNDNNIITIVFNSPKDSYTFTNLAKQSRAYSITVYAAGATAPDSGCKHANLKTEGKSDATCTTAGHTGTIKCLDCGEVLDAGEAIAALGHADADNNKTCDVCGVQIGSSSSSVHVYAAWVTIRNATCTEAGLERRDCDHCSEYETREIPATGHTDENGDNTCDVCEENTHTCKEVTGFKAFWNAIVNFFRRIFGQPELCPCGETVIEKKEQ